MKRPLLALAIPSLIVTLVLFLTYYFFSIKPNLHAIRVLNNTQNAISQHRANLLQNRLSIMAMVNLDSATSNFNDERSALIQTAISTNDKGVKNLESSYMPKAVSSAGPATAKAKYVNNELMAKLDGLLSKNKEILKQQEDVLDDVTSLDQALDNLFKYDPTADLVPLDTIENKEELINRSANARNGLDTALQDIDELTEKFVEKYPNIENELISLNALINKEIELLSVLSGQLLNNNFAGANETLELIGVLHDQVKSQALETELAIIRSPTMVELLKDQTNLMLEYDLLINRIESF